MNDERMITLEGNEDMEQSEVVLIKTPESIKDIEHLNIEIHFVNLYQIQQEFVAFLELEDNRLESNDVIVGVKLIQIDKHSKS